MQEIDVVMLTKNSEHLLRKCLSSIYQNVPVKRLIIIDGFSTDSTLQILKKFNAKYGNIKILTVAGSRAKAREEGIAQVQTPWFLFVDSDVVLCKNWYLRAQKSIRDDVGAVWGVNIDVIPNMHDRRVLHLQTVVAKQCFELRGGTHDTLLRTDLVRDIKIPEHLHTYEDAYIIKHLKNKGYQAVIGDDIYCLHFKPPANWNLKNAATEAILELRCGLLGSRNFSYVIYYPFFISYWILQLALKGMKSFTGGIAPPKDDLKKDEAKPSLCHLRK
ncbi:MAG: glycosyltransferase family 2 protein [Candidatus Bathyarchaeota archaeon]|nr:glycosyltransferase family 2 protein [Candidatus Bathyarchaeota archaeon]